MISVVLFYCNILLFNFLKDEHKAVAESAVVGIPHDIHGESIYAFITLKENVKEPKKQIIDDIKQTVKREIAAYAVPNHILLAPNLPKTRSGKTMRRILRKIAMDKTEDFGDTSTLADPSVVDDLIERNRVLKTKYN